MSVAARSGQAEIYPLVDNKVADDICPRPAPAQLDAAALRQQLRQSRNMALQLQLDQPPTAAGQQLTEPVSLSPEEGQVGEP